MIEKALVLCPDRISLGQILNETLKEFSGEVVNFDVKAAIGRNSIIINTQVRRLSYRFRSLWDRYFLKLANGLILEEVNRIKPDLVLVYNSEYLLPEVCSQIKKTSRLVFFLGDSPFYTPLNDYYLACLEYADLILVPDTFWMSQLNAIGLEKTLYFVPGIDGRSYFTIDAGALNDEPAFEVLYVGSSYKNSWGYKKAMLMSRFTHRKLRIYGNEAWERWFGFFPELKPAFVMSSYIPTGRLNRMFNRAGIIPVDGNPSILNGTHLRLLEALAAGALPLIEYRKDVLDEIFAGTGIELPVIYNYNEAGRIADYWLADEVRRNQTVTAMRTHILTRYSAGNNAERIKERLGIKE
jgi:hypothetical protein